MVVEPATPAQFNTFLSDYGYSVAGDKTALLALSFAFLSTLDFCAEEGDTVPGQCFIAYAMSAEGGSFNPVANVDDKTLIKKNLGRSGIVKEYSINEDLTGTDSISMLRRLPMAYGTLKAFLCQGSTSGIGNFELVR